jgi:hypothetical protein
MDFTAAASTIAKLLEQLLIKANVAAMANVIRTTVNAPIARNARQVTAQTVAKTVFALPAKTAAKKPSKRFI